MSDRSEERVRAILNEASALVGAGEVRIEVVSVPVHEWVYVSLENDRVVVSDNGATFAWIAGVHGDKGEYVPWSPQRALGPAEALGVSLDDETERNERGEVLAIGWRLARSVARDESVADAVQSVARAIDGVFAVHVRADALTHGSYFRDDGPD